ncbi:MAG: hypothetical protein ACRD2Z_16040 [Thermoanaerobaculia bacterium]
MAPAASIRASLGSWWLSVTDSYLPHQAEEHEGEPAELGDVVMAVERQQLRAAEAGHEGRREQHDTRGEHGDADPLLGGSTLGGTLAPELSP